MPKPIASERKLSRSKITGAGRSFPVSGEAAIRPELRRTQKVMEGGYGTVMPNKGQESAVVKRSRAQLIQRLGILPRKSK